MITNTLGRRQFLEAIPAGSLGLLAGGLFQRVAAAQTPAPATEKQSPT
jgi:hypothetical protein